MPHPGHHSPHSPRSSHDGQDEEENPTHLPVDPDKGPLAGDLPVEGPSEGGTEPG